MPRVAAAASFGSCGNVRFGMRAMRQLLQHTIQFGNPGFCVTRLAAADQGDQITRALHEIAVCLVQRSEEHTSELQSLMRISYAVFCLKKKKYTTNSITTSNINTFPNKL